jgi:hypothetical protein
MAGFLSGIGDLLNNPAVQQLLPAALGAAGGALTSPRLSGARGAIGRGLVGGAEGLAAGQQTAAYSQEAKLRQAQLQHTQIEDKVASFNLNKAQQDQQRLADLRTQNPSLSGLSDADLYNQVSLLPGIKRQLMIAAKNPDPKMQPFTSKLQNVDLNSLDYDSAKSLFTAYTTYKEAPGEPLVQVQSAKGQNIWVPRSQAVNQAVAPPKEDADLAAVRATNIRKTEMEMAGTLPARPTSRATGEVTESQASAHAMNWYEKMRSENSKVEIENAKNDYPGATPAPLPHPDLPATFEDWRSSKNGQDFVNAYKGTAAKPTGAPASRDELKAAPDWHTVKGATAPAVGKTKREDNTYKTPDGKIFVVKHGFGYPG